MSDRGKEFAELVHTLVSSEERGFIDNLAAKMGMDYDTFYARLINRVRFSAEEIRKLLSVFPDPRIAAYFLESSPFMIAERNMAGDEGPGCHKEVQQSTNTNVIEAADILKEVDRALTDGKIDHLDKIRINTEIDEAERALATLRARVGKPE